MDADRRLGWARAVNHLDVLEGKRTDPAGAAG